MSEVDNSDTYRSYWHSVDCAAGTVIENVDDGQDEQDALWEVCDGSYWVIYTHAAMKTMQHCNNHDAYFEHMGEAIEAESWGELVSKLAFYAFFDDVSDRYQTLRNAEDDDDTDGEDMDEEPCVICNEHSVGGSHG